MQDPEARERELEELRSRIAEIDQRILTLAKARIQCAREIGKHKLRAELPVRSYATEKLVLERTRAYCEELGLPFELGEGVLHVLIDEAVRVQEELREASPRANPGHALVVGGGGGIGGWLCRYLEAQGHRVSVLDPAGAPLGFARVDSLREGWSGADVVALAVPLEPGRALYEEILELPPGPFVFDVFSVKSHVIHAIRRAVAAGHTVASVHPMFGPSARLLSGRALVVCDTGSTSARDRVRELFGATSLDLVEIPLEQHDRRMADILGLSHALSLVFARALVASSFDARQMAEVASTTFRKQTKTTREVVDENPALYFEIQRLNPHTDQALSRLASALEALRAEIAEDRSTDFESAIERARALMRDL